MSRELEIIRISSLPADAFYISNFISAEEEAWLMQKVSKDLASHQRLDDLTVEKRNCLVLLSCQIHSPSV